jgi:two-component system, OmpR family, sensor histidine kinase VicK
LTITYSNTDTKKIRILDGIQSTTNAILRLLSKSKLGVDICSNYTVLSLAIVDEVFQKALSEAKRRGVKLRCVIEITKENIAYCKELMGRVELRHLDGLKGTFILNEREYLSISTATLLEGKTIPQIVHTNIEQIVEQQQHIFDTFWNKTISAQEKIGEIEKEVEPFNIDIIRDRKCAESLFTSEIQHARSEVLIAVSSIRYLEYLTEIGLINSIKQAKSKGVNVMILYSEEKRDGIAAVQVISAITRYAKIKRISGIQGSILLIDNSKVLTISEDERVDALVAIHSDSNSLVKNFGSLLDTLWNETEILKSIIRVKDNLADTNKQLAEANEQLKIHHKMQEEFINIASHEIKTPTQAILGYSEMSEMEPERSKEYLQPILRNARRLQTLTNDILDVTRIESQSLNLNKERVNLDDVISSLLVDYLNQIERERNQKDIKLVYENNDDNKPRDIFVEADRERLTQVISNLISNAIKFTQEGVIKVSVEVKDNRDAVITIKDNGEGIDSEIMPRLFTKFATKSIMGTGLGLFISKSIVDAHGGKIWGENNKDGRGATFSFSLPISSG